MSRSSTHARQWVPSHLRKLRSGRKVGVVGHWRYSWEHREQLRKAEGRTTHLYTNPRERAKNLAAFEAEYGKAKGKRVFGAVVGKVRREQIAEGRRGHVERIAPHTSTSRKGRRFRVRGHEARI